MLLSPHHVRGPPCGGPDVQVADRRRGGDRDRRHVRQRRTPAGRLPENRSTRPDAVRVPALSYREVKELAWFGAKVLHPMTVAPVQEAGIPIRIRSAFLPASPGTIVRADAPKTGPVKAVTSIRKLSLIHISEPTRLGM